MRDFGRLVLICGALGLLAGGAFAQPGDRDYPYDSRYRGYSVDVVERASSDLDFAGYDSGSYFGGRERREIDQARRDLIRFRENWSRGRFDRDRLDGAIEHIHHFVDSRDVDPRMRERLERDLYSLRDFRANSGYQGRWR